MDGHIVRQNIPRYQEKIKRNGKDDSFSKYDKCFTSTLLLLQYNKHGDTKILTMKMVHNILFPT